MALNSAYTDEQLLKLLKDGDEGAFAELYERHWERLYHSACRKFADKEQAQEIVHDVFLDIWRRRGELSINYLPTYLEKAVRYRVINFVNRNKLPAFFDLMDSMACSPYTADNLVHARDTTALVEAWIEALPETRRAIFVKHYFQEMTAQEIALEMKLSPKTVHNQLSLSLQYLRNRFGHLLFLAALLLHRH